MKVRETSPMRRAFAAWPPELQDRWRESERAQNFSRQTRERYLRAAELLLSITLTPPSSDDWQEFFALLAARYASSTVRTYMVDASYAVRILWPAEEWAWLVDQLRRRKRKAAPKPAYKPVPVDWPAEWNAAWQLAHRQPDRESRRQRLRNIYRGSGDGTAPVMVGSQRKPDRRLEPSKWSSDFRARIVRGANAYLKFLKDEKRPLEVTRVNVDAYIGSLESRGLSDHTIAMHIDEMALFMRAIIAPQEDWAWLQGFAKALKVAAKARRNKAERIVSVPDLISLAEEMMAEARGGIGGARDAIRFRDGLLIGYLAFMGNRLRNISDMYLGKTVETQEETVRVTFATTKNGSRWSAAWPAKFERAFWEYVNIYRPLLGPRDDALWTARDGFGMTRATISQRVGDITLARLGRRVSPHLFRDCIATQAQRVSPEAVRPAAKVLGHSERVLDKHYGHAESMAASKALAKVVDTMIPMQVSRRSR